MHSHVPRTKMTANESLASALKSKSQSNQTFVYYYSTISSPILHIDSYNTLLLEANSVRFDVK